LRPEREAADREPTDMSFASEYKELTRRARDPEQSWERSLLGLELRSVSMPGSAMPCTDTVYMSVAAVLTGTCIRVASGACQHGDELGFKHSLHIVDKIRTDDRNMATESWFS
jgi:hypothetical protein